MLSRRRAMVLGAAGFSLLGTTALRASDLQPGEIETATRIIDGDNFALRSGLVVRLAAIEAPKLASKRQDYKAWPFADEAKAALSALIHRRRVQLYFGGRKRNRYDNAIAQVYALDGQGRRDLWVQAEMIRLGMARVMSWADDQADIAALYALEEQAREKGRGIWSDPFYAVRDPDPNALAQHVDSVQIIEGIITSVADVRGRIYLNFGADYKSDFTITVAPKHVKRFTAKGLDLLSLEGARVRVRGWIELINGPAIWLDHPERLEVLS